MRKMLLSINLSPHNWMEIVTSSQKHRNRSLKYLATRRKCSSSMCDSRMPTELIHKIATQPAKHKNGLHAYWLVYKNFSPHNDVTVCWGPVIIHCLSVNTSGIVYILFFNVFSLILSSLREHCSSSVMFDVYLKIESSTQAGFCRQLIRRQMSWLINLV